LLIFHGSEQIVILEQLLKLKSQDNFPDLGKTLFIKDVRSQKRRLV